MCSSLADQTKRPAIETQYRSYSCSSPWLTYVCKQVGHSQQDEDATLGGCRRRLIGGITRIPHHLREKQ